MSALISRRLKFRWAEKALAAPSPVCMGATLKIFVFRRTMFGEAVCVTMRRAAVVLCAMFGVSAGSLSCLAQDARALLAPYPQATPEVVGVVELFTSQGCSSCPPADALLAQLARQNNLVALTFPVDIWDYMGWKDTLASPDNTARQKAYAAARRDGEVYTPQLVVNGAEHVVGSDKPAIFRALAGQQARLSLSISMRRLASGDLSIDVVGADKENAAQKPFLHTAVFLLETLPQARVAIRRGENAGHEIIYTNVTRKVTRLGQWQGRAAHFDVTPLAGHNPFVIVQRYDESKAVDGAPTIRLGPILGAAKLF